MSLAMYAAPFDDENTQINSKDNDGLIARKRQANNRTQKRLPKENNYSEKVNSVLQSIHNSSEQSSGLADFNPLPPPTSVGVEQTRIRDINERQESKMDGSSYTLENTDNNQPQQSQEDYYKRFMPNYDKLYKTTPHNLPYYNTAAPVQQMSGENGVLLEKLNYMIHLLEEQQDERTGNVTEEVVLYCFLGIFIIFVVDSFVRVGKYVR
uniref:Uncharacterized protein n=1 Tax=viral metagenome TaxID=1070528 RepID=A0A6C0K2S3_9ZZZZ